CRCRSPARAAATPRGGRPSARTGCRSGQPGPARGADRPSAWAAPAAGAAARSSTARQTPMACSCRPGPFKIRASRAGIVRRSKYDNEASHMSGVSRFTVSVPTRLLEAVERKLVKGDETRSAVVRRLLEEALCEVDEREDVQRWIRSYQESPQTEEELGWADEAARQFLAEVP